MRVRLFIFAVFLTLTLSDATPFWWRRRRRRSSCRRQDCRVSNWSGWSECNQMCGSHGVRSRRRSIVSHAKCGGRGCDRLTDIQACNRVACWTLNKPTKILHICEGNSAEIRCPVNYQIRIEYANFGRRTNQICRSKHMRTTNCHASGSKNKVEAVCKDRRSCKLWANTGVFGEPCQGTYKYLEVKYRCVADPLAYAVRVFSPLVWMHKDEHFRPSDVDFFLRNAKMIDNHGREVCRKHPLTSWNLCTGRSDYFLVTKQPLRHASATNPPVLRGLRRDDVMLYAVTKTKGSYIDVYYWMFFPYNRGKNVCIGLITWWGCAGGRSTFGNHVGDFEHVSIRLSKQFQPLQAYVSSHNFGKRYNYNSGQTLFRNGGDYILIHGTHPVFYSALGSHGLWTRPGSHVYKKIFGNNKLTDHTNQGHPWRTWKRILVIKWGQWTGEANFLNYKGRWGNRKRKCKFSEKLSGECVLNNGPTGILSKSYMNKKNLF